MPDEYTLHYEYAEDISRIEWHLVAPSKMQKAQNGSYDIDDNGDGTCTVTYTLEVDLAIGMLGMFRKKAEKMIMDAALKQLKRRVETLTRASDGSAPIPRKHDGTADPRPPARRPSGWSRRARLARRAGDGPGLASGFGALGSLTDVLSSAFGQDHHPSGATHAGPKIATGRRRVLRLPDLPGDRGAARPESRVRRAARDRRGRPRRGRGQPAARVNSSTAVRDPARRRRHPRPGSPTTRSGARPPVPAMMLDRRAAADDVWAAATAAGRAGDDRGRARGPKPAKPMARKAVKRTAPPDADGRTTTPDGGVVSARARAEGSGSVTLTIGVDVGGTKVAGGVVDEDGHGHRDRPGATRRPTTSPRPGT